MTDTNICDYGCGLDAIKFFSSTQKWCCSESVNKCPGKRQKDSEKKKGKNPFLNREHPRGMTGKKSWNSGKKTPRDIVEKIRQSLLGKSHPQTEETRKKISESHKKNKKGGGYRPGSGIGEKTWYESPIAGRIYLQSTYELRLAKFLDSNGFIWKRNNEGYQYEWEGNRKYYPDFIVSVNDCELFLETKGFVSTKDIAKWQQFPNDLRVILEQELLALENDSMKISDLPVWGDLLKRVNLKIHNQYPPKCKERLG